MENQTLKEEAVTEAIAQLVKEGFVVIEVDGDGEIFYRRTDKAAPDEEEISFSV